MFSESLASWASSRIEAGNHETSTTADFLVRWRRTFSTCSLSLKLMMRIMILMKDSIREAKPPDGVVHDGAAGLAGCARVNSQLLVGCGGLLPRGEACGVELPLCVEPGVLGKDLEAGGGQCLALLSCRVFAAA